MSKIQKFAEFLQENYNPNQKITDLKTRTEMPKGFSSWDDWFAKGLQAWSNQFGSRIQFGNDSAQLQLDAEVKNLNKEVKYHVGSPAFPGGIAMKTTRDALYALAYAIHTYNQNGGKAKVQIIGHTSKTGEEAHNQRLSEQRAQAVANHLTSLGIDRGVIGKVEGKGFSTPLPNTKPEDEVNRRVEIKVVNAA